MDTKFLLSLICGICILYPAHAQALEIGAAWYGNSGMAKRIMGGFEERMSEIAPDAKIETRPDLADVDALEASIADFEQSKDGMLILRSNGAKYLGENPTTKPAFIGASNNPEFLGAVDDMNNPDKNFTGVTYHIPYEIRLSIVSEVVPDGNVLIMLEEGHPGAPVDEKGSNEACPKVGLNCTVKKYNNIDEAVADVKAMQEQFDAFVIGSQAELIDNTAQIIDVSGSKPVFGFTKAPVEKGAVAGYVAGDHKLGRMLADSVAEVLIDGKDVSEVPVKTDPSPVLFVNANTIAELGVNIPLDIMNTAEIIE